MDANNRNIYFTFRPLTTSTYDAYLVENLQWSNWPVISIPLFLIVLCGLFNDWNSTIKEQNMTIKKYRYQTLKT